MSACRAGCETEALAGAHLCRDDMERWRASPEWVRCMAGSDGDTVSDTAFVDFCTRMRLERQNGAKT